MGFPVEGDADYVLPKDCELEYYDHNTGNKIERHSQTTLTRTQLCEWTAKKMGWEPNATTSQYWLKDGHFRSVNWLLTGDGMLDVLEWLRRENYVAVVALTPTTWKIVVRPELWEDMQAPEIWVIHTGAPLGLLLAAYEALEGRKVKVRK